jgi:hypothetical protein
MVSRLPVEPRREPHALAAVRRWDLRPLFGGPAFLVGVRRLLPCGLAVALLAALPCAAAAAERRAQPLVDLPPAPGARVVDRVVDGTPSAPRARAAQASGRTTVVRAADGQRVRVTLSDAYAADPAIARSYVTFLSDLPHGSELRLLRMRIVTPQAVPSSCGAPDAVDVLACYLPRSDLMVVPGEAPQEQGVTQAYVVAHEYGHHIANHRSNAPFEALDFGPKRWASQQDVCHHWLADRLAPGDEADNYRANPGEAWAETYARLKYPEPKWRYTELLRPTQGANVAALRDVGDPWRGPRRQAFRGRLGRLDAQDRHSFKLTLDGTLRVRLQGPRTANYDLVLRANGRLRGRTRAAGSRDRVRWGACVQAPETITVTVRRRSGAGPYTLRVTSAG